MASSIFSLLFLTICSLSHVLSYSSKNLLDSHDPMKTMAEKFISQLNLFPKHDINIIVSSKDQIVDQQRLFEKKLILSYLGHSGATVQDLAHHAGYYHLLHTKAARLYFLSRVNILNDHL